MEVISVAFFIAFRLGESATVRALT